MSAFKSDNDKYDGWTVQLLDSLIGNAAPQGSTNSVDGKKEKVKKPKIPTRLVLHLDINETILLGDDAGGDSTSDSIQKMLAKSAFCQMPPKAENVDWDSTQQIEPTHWWDGQKIGHEKTMPPLYTGWEWPPNCCPYYRTNFKKFSKEFVAEADDTNKVPGQPHHGKIYKPIWEECNRLLTILPDTPSSRHHPHLLPAFYQSLDYLRGLQKEQETSPLPPVTLVFRTFGTDIQEVAKWVNEYAKVENCPWLEIQPNQLLQGRWKQVESGENPRVIYQLWDLSETKLVAENEEEILKLLNSGTIFGIRDDYNYWKKNEYLPTTGKPIWIPNAPPPSTGDSNENVFCHHVLFDDNIHNLPDDGIACIRQQQKSSFESVDASIMHCEDNYQGIHLKRVPTVEPVLNPNWYIEQIEHSRVLLQEKLMKQLLANDHE